MNTTNQHNTMPNDAITALKIRRDELLAYRDSLKLKQLNQKLQKTLKKPKVQTLDTYNRSKSLIEKYSRLPILDIDKRLKFARLTCPWMQVSDVVKTSTSSNTASTLEFQLRFEKCGVFQVSIKVDNKEESILSLEINIISIRPIDEEQLIRELIKESMKSLDLTLFVYRLNTLVRMRHKRKRMWVDILESLDISKVNSINGYDTSKNVRSDTLSIILFDNSPSSVTFKTKSASVFVTWAIRFTSNQRHCVSEFKATWKNNDVSKLYQSLIKANDVKTATLQILNL